MARLKYKGSYRGIERMLNDSMITNELKARGQRVLAAARASAPIGSSREGDQMPGAFKNSFEMHERVQPSPRGGSRTVVDVVSVDPLGALKEMGHMMKDEKGERFVKGSNTLKRALDAAGG